MSCRNSAYGDINMQKLLEQETTDEINEEDVTALSQGRRL
jgi:hypothetical protein